MEGSDKNKKKKVGIITYHRYTNPGTVLQALALQNMIEKIGYSAELIDFEARVKESQYDFIRSHIKRIPFYILNYKKYYFQKKNEDKNNYRKQLSESFHACTLHLSSQKYFSSEELCSCPPVYDGYIVGSDQTWNPNVSNNPDAFYLTFVKDAKRCGSYAPSIAASGLTNDQVDRLKKLLSHIQWLSCRELSGAKIIEELTGRNVVTVLDPTLLLNSKEWEKYKKPVKTPKRYILQYFLGESKGHRKYVKNLSNKVDIPIFNISTTYLDWENGNVNICGPDEFLWLIDNAALVCTDSFHGTAFSINFNTPLISFERYSNNNIKSENSRLYDLLSAVNLEGRMIDLNNNNVSLNLDFSHANIKLEALRRTSESYLREMLNSITAD